MSLRRRPGPKVRPQAGQRLSDEILAAAEEEEEALLPLVLALVAGEGSPLLLPDALPRRGIWRESASEVSSSSSSERGLILTDMGLVTESAIEDKLL